MASASELDRDRGGRWRSTRAAAQDRTTGRARDKCPVRAGAPKFGQFQRAADVTPFQG